MTMHYIVELYDRSYTVTRGDDGIFDLPTELRCWEGYGTALKPAWEPISIFSKGKPNFDLNFEAPFFYTGKATKNETTVNGRIVNKHTTKKPLELMEHLVKHASQKGDLVLDPYIGSGTTAVACMLHDRRYLGFEKDPEFYKLAQLRVEEAYDAHGIGERSAMIEMFGDT